MAIIDDLPGVKIEITVEGAALKEYEDHTVKEYERTMTHYIEVASGQVFAVSIELDPCFKFKGDGITFRIYADGNFIESILLQKRKGPRFYICEGKYTNDGKLRKCRFASIEAVSDVHLKDGEASKYKDLGTVKVVCTHEQVRGRSYYTEGSQITGLGTVAEKALKGRTVSDNVELMDAEPTFDGKALRRRSTVPVPGEQNPAATFVFCYRSLAALKTMYIILRTPTPPPLEERDADGLTREEVKEMQTRLRELQSQKEAQLKIKREKKDDNPRQRKRARPSADVTQIEFDDDGSFRERSVSTLAAEDRVVIELD